MITNFKIFENNRQYIDVDCGHCPVCGTQGKVVDKEEYGAYEGEYTFRCPTCEFGWYNEYAIEDYGGGDEMIFQTETEDLDRKPIEDGFYVDDDSYNKEKLEEYETMKKYNL